ncbi:hypothetical protein A2U01_0040017, partial [Trifolium medium]|nr:hypothetical protein [Trifolium medium]
MQAENEGRLESLKCAAYNCHRNFLHKETTYIITGGGDPLLDNRGRGRLLYRQLLMMVEGLSAMEEQEEVSSPSGG